MEIHTLSECIVMVDDEKYILNNEQASEKKTWRRPDFVGIS